MKKTLFSFMAFAMMAVLTTGNAHATPVDANTLNLTELQSLFNTIGATSLNANRDETGSEVFTPQSTGATATYIATVSYSLGDLEFGFYNRQDITDQLTLFDTASGNAPGDSTQVYLDFGADYTEAYTMSGGHSVIDSTGYLGNFGFYVTTASGTFYSESDLNTYDHFLTYMGVGDQVDANGDGNYLNDFAHWYVAVDGTNAGLGDSATDFTDFVAQFESVQPVPEPGTILLLGTGLVGLAFANSRRKKA